MSIVDLIGRKFDTTPTSERIIVSFRALQTTAYLESLTKLKDKLKKKRATIKAIIEKKIEDNLKEINKWKDLLATVVDECIDDKLKQISAQVGMCTDADLVVVVVCVFDFQSHRKKKRQCHHLEFAQAHTNTWSSSLVYHLKQHISFLSFTTGGVPHHNTDGNVEGVARARQSTCSVRR
jgi:hypothetical protein